MIGEAASRSAPARADRAVTRPLARKAARRWPAPAAWPVGLFLALYLVPLGWRPMLLPDEHRYAEVPREMLASGDWVVPRLDGFVYFEKPALGYWLIAGSEALFGHHRFAVRLPSALAVGLTALLLAALLRRAAPRLPAAAPLAAGVFLTSLLVAGIGTTALVDGPLTLCLTAALAAFFLATESPPGSWRERRWLALAGVGCGLAFLTKGFLAFAVPALVAAAYLGLQRRWRDLARLPWLPAAAAGLVAVPWSLAIHLRDPDFWRYFFWIEHVRRYLASGHAQHPQPWWLLAAATPVLLLPWTVLAPAAAVGLRDAPGAAVRRLVRYAAVWAGVTYLFFSTSSGKLLTYVLPAFPALALLLAVGLAAGLDAAAAGGAGSAQRRVRLGAAGLAALLGLAAVGFGGWLAAGELVPSWAPSAPPFTPTGRGYALAAALAAGALVALAARRVAPQRAPLVLGLSLAPLLLVAQIALPVRVLDSKAPGPLFERHRAEVGPHTVVISDFAALRAACWVFERDDVLLVGPPGELAYGIERPAARDRHLTLAEARRLIESRPGGAVLVASAASYRRWRPLLPRPLAESVPSGRGWAFARY